jgi:chemotaxis protein methyltransferase CheR
MLAIQQQLELTDCDFQAIAKVVYDHCGINLKADKKELVRSRLARLVHQHKMTSYKDYLDFVLKDTSGSNFAAFINRISTNLTSFFREEHHFEYLRENVLPELIKKQVGTVRIRAWSAGCSTGEEPYSLAITVAEALPNPAKANVRILASDISTSVLHTAMQGRYSMDRVATVPPAARNKYFTMQHEGANKVFAANPELKKMLIFKQINLMQKWPIATELDFIFCRNVMIYFDKPTQERLVGRFTELLKPGGYLFIGHSESLSSVNHQLKYVGPTIYGKQ